MESYYNQNVQKSAFSSDVAVVKSQEHNGQYQKNCDSSADSGLKVFVIAKQNIASIFDDIDECVSEVAQLIEGMYATTSVVDESECTVIKSYVSQVAHIRHVLQRDHMKVAFFGRTSNGKSTVINAMLGEQILPSGIGHVTQCFCQVEGRSGTEAYLTREGSDEKLSVTNIQELANALSHSKLDESALIRVHWPRERCSLLRDGVVLVDSPGADVSDNLDDCIDNNCKDADVFVYVLNAESTMTRAETAFFKKVSQQLSKPNVFILNNRWDASANEPELCKAVRAQLSERCTDFLTRQLKVCADEKEASERVFFVSAREALRARIAKANGMPPFNASTAEGYQARYAEFQDFEQKFQECISKSAVRTKFQERSSSGKRIALNTFSVLGNILDRIKEHRQEKLEKQAALVSRTEGAGAENERVLDELNVKIAHLTEQVRRRVWTSLNQEIGRLHDIIAKFNCHEFRTDVKSLRTYKKQLDAFVQTSLSSSLHLRLTAELAAQVEALRTEMVERLLELVGDSTSLADARSAIHGEPFLLDYSLKCENLCSKFQEDLDFKFSFGIKAMIARLRILSESNCGSRTNAENNSQSAAGMEETQDSPTTLSNVQVALVQASRFVASSMGSQFSLVAVVCTTGLVRKVVGWRVIGSATALFVGLYAYERLLWTDAAKERTFKKQYIRHISDSLKWFSEFVSKDCAKQVEWQLMQSLTALRRLVDTATVDMNEEKADLAHQLSLLHTYETNINRLRNRSSIVHDELSNFERQYIHST